MTDPGDDATGRHRLARWLSRMPTGAKLFLILSAALLPLALIALFAGLQANRSADDETRSRLRVAAAESARTLAIELIGDMTALRVALNALDADRDDTPSCARAQGVFAEQLANGTRFAISDAQGRVLCGSAGLPDVASPTPVPSGIIDAAIVPQRGLALGITSAGGRLKAVALFPQAALAELARPSGFTPPFAAALMRGSDRLELDTLPNLMPIDRTESVTLPIGVADVTFEMTVRSAPITSPIVIAMVLPLLMWAAAAGIGWFVVDRLLIRPLRMLRARVAEYRPGEEIDPGELSALPAYEIQELGETFRSISRTVVLHEAGLAEGLVRQTKLTREVHHRVKNNLQVISSLINFHARGAMSAEATRAYAGIQRRVDALAVVHRNHFAEIEETRGLSLRSVIGDLASNIRATAPEGTGLSIVLDLEPFLATQDVGTAVAFLITEIVELAMTCQPDAAIRISLKADPDAGGRALLRISAPALADNDMLRQEVGERYGRVLEGLSRQLRSRLHHDPLVGAYEISLAVTGRD